MVEETNYFSAPANRQPLKYGHPQPMCIAATKATGRRCHNPAWGDALFCSVHKKTAANSRLTGKPMHIYAPEGTEVTPQYRSGMSVLISDLKKDLHAPVVQYFAGPADAVFAKNGLSLVLSRDLPVSVPALVPNRSVPQKPSEPPKPRLHPTLPVTAAPVPFDALASCIAVLNRTSPLESTAERYHCLLSLLFDVRFCAKAPPTQCLEALDMIVSHFGEEMDAMNSKDDKGTSLTTLLLKIYKAAKVATTNDEAFDGFVADLVTALVTARGQCRNMKNSFLIGTLKPINKEIAALIGQPSSTTSLTDVSSEIANLIWLINQRPFKPTFEDLSQEVRVILAKSPILESHYTAWINAVAMAVDVPLPTSS